MEQRLKMKMKKKKLNQISILTRILGGKIMEAKFEDEDEEESDITQISP